MKTFPEKRIRARETARASKSFHLLVISSRQGGKVGGMNGAGQEENACAPWPRGRFRAATCAPTLSLSLSLSLFSSLFHPPVESTAASHIYKGSLGIATLRIITAVTCEQLNPRSSLLSPETNAQEFEPGEFDDLFSMHPARPFVSLLIYLFVSFSYVIDNCALGNFQVLSWKMCFSAICFENSIKSCYNLL